MADVAGLAGVSPQTVSRVINESGYVGHLTRERVLAAMRELSYRPNSAARALVTGRSNTLGVVSIDTTLFGPASILLGLERAAHAHGYFVSIASLESLDPAEVLNAVERLERQNVEGILINAGQGGIADQLGHVSTSVPLVAVEDEASSSIPVAAVDQFAGAVAATRLLLDLGHRTVWHIAGPVDWESGRRRLEGWRTTLRDAGAELPSPLIGDWTPPPATSSAGSSPRTPRSPRSSSPTTRWRWASCARCTSPGVRCPATSVSSASTTSPRRAT